MRVRGLTVLVVAALSGCRAAPTPGGARPPRAAAAAPTSALIVDTVRSDMGDPSRVRFVLELFGRLHVFGDSSVTAILSFRCDRGNLTAELNADYALQDAQVRTRFDSEPAQTVGALDAISGSAEGEGFVSFGRPAAILRRLARSSSFLVEVANAPSDPTVARFSTRGLGPRADTVLTACKERP